MTIYYYPFESHETGDESNPYDRAITAEQERMFNKLRYGNGVFNPDSGSLQVTSNSNMTVTVGKGGCHIEGAIAYNDAPIILPIEAADATLNRIDRVVAQFNTSDSVRAINILVRIGTAAANPVPPEARTQSNLYELVLADIYVGKNASSISTANITDQRLSSELCGQVVPAIPTPLNLDDIYSQYQASLDEWLDTVAMALDGTLAGNLQNQISALGVRIDNLILSTGNSPIEVKDARLGYDGTAYSTLKERLDTENSELKSDLADVNKKFTGGTLNPDGNLISEAEIEIGAWIDNNTGTKEKNQYTSSYCCTPFIEIEPSTSYYAVCFAQNNEKAPYSICFYTEDNTFISSLRHTGLFTTLNNAKYIGLCWNDCNDMVGTGAFLLKKSTEAVTVYEAPSYTPTRLVHSDYVTKEVTDNLDERVTTLEPSSRKQYINLASDYYITNGDTLELFYRGLLNLGDYKKYNIKIECSVGGCFEKRYIFTPTSANVGNDYPLTLSLYDDNDKLIESATTTIHCIEKKINPENQVNVLCVGDSLTVNGEWVTELQRLLINDGLTNVNFIGTCGTAPAKYEGYGGWTFDSYTNPMSTNAYMWVNVSSHDKTSADQHSVYVDSNGAKWKIETIETSRIKMIRTSGSSAIPTSGSLTWESGGDNHNTIVYDSVSQANGNPFWSDTKNGNDFSAYATSQNVTSIDYCLILMGWNQTHLSEFRTKEIINDFVQSLKDSYPNCKFIFAGLQIPSLDGCGHNYGCSWYWKDKVNFVFNLQKWYEDLTLTINNSVFAQVSGQFDSENNMPMYQRQVNKRNTTKEYYGGNGVHPANSGYMQVADVFYRAFHAF